jgi:hypothetical protein
MGRRAHLSALQIEFGLAERRPQVRPADDARGSLRCPSIIRKIAAETQHID